MHSFDPDEDTPYLEPLEETGIQLGSDHIAIDEQRALDLLDEITRDLPGGGESREGQRQMVRAVASAFSTSSSTIIEAGTGVGKSLAYLVPAALAGRRVVVATATKNLQDQLASKDAPSVAAHTRGVRVAILKGKQNYLCKNRSEAMSGGVQGSFADGEDVPKGVADQMRRILQWANETETGDRDELTFEVDSRAWHSLSVTPQECLHRVKCPQGHSCFHELARDKAAEASIVVVNTHLYASHLASGSILLPPHDLVVFDEAHEVMDIFATLLGTSLNAQRIRAVAGLARPVLGPEDAQRCIELVTAADRLATALELQYDSGQLTGLDTESTSALQRVSELVTAIVESLRQLPSDTPDQDARKTRTLGQALHLSNDLDRFFSIRKGELLYLIRRDKGIDLELSIVDVGPRLKDELWGDVTAVLTSATIPDSLPRNLGLDDVTIERFESPFDYQSHSLLYVPSDFPERNHESAESAIISELVDLIIAAGGRTLALFTNRSVMKRVAEAVASQVETPVLVQDTLSRQKLIERFRDSEEASLFAVTSFWQGVDVPGHSLSLVTIDRLPFSVPGDPLAEARRSKSDNPFMEVDLPHATMLLAQGVGRLIRSASDRGVVAVLDTRLAEKAYRNQMFKKLPPMKRTRDKLEVVEFLRQLRS